MKHSLPKRMRDYLREQGACCKPSTVKNYRLTLGRFYGHLKAASPNNPVGSLTRNRLQDYLSDLCGRDLAPCTKVHYLLAVRKYLGWEAERGKLSGDLLSVLDRSGLPAIPEYLPRPLTAENDLRLQNRLRASGHRHAPAFLLLRQTGMRISELINLPPDCVLSGPRGEKYLKVPLGKMNTERLIPLCGESLSLIEKIRQRTAMAPRRLSDPRRLIAMPGRVSRVYSLLSHHFKNLTGNMTDQNKPVTFHRLRHTYATTLLTGGVSLVSLMKLLGHRRIEMTLRYAKVTPTHLREEYLKAVRTLEKQTALAQSEKSGVISGQLHPAEMIRQIVAFLDKTRPLPSPQKKNLLLRLTRIKNDLSLITFPQKFKISFQREKQTSGLTG